MTMTLKPWAVVDVQSCSSCPFGTDGVCRAPDRDTVALQVTGDKLLPRGTWQAVGLAEDCPLRQEVVHVTSVSPEAKRHAAEWAARRDLELGGGGKPS